MPQIYPVPSSVSQSFTINTASPLTGGGTVSPGGAITLGLSTSNSATRAAYTVSPAPDGVTASFTIDGVTTGLSIQYADIFVDGKLQTTANASIGSNVISFTTAPLSGSKIYAVFSSPNDDRSQFSLIATSSTTFSFPTTPQGTYVDVYDSTGTLQIPSATGYYLDIVDGVYSAVFSVAPSQPLVAVYDPSTNSGRQSYALTPAADGVTTSFQISGGSPSTTYIDIYEAGLFEMVGSTHDYDLSYLSGNWTVTFSTAPTSGIALTAVFAPATVVPPSQSIGSVVNSLNGLNGGVILAAGSNISLTPSGNTVTIASTGGSGATLYSVSLTGSTLPPGSAETGTTAYTAPPTAVLSASLYDPTSPAANQFLSAFAYSQNGIICWSVVNVSSSPVTVLSSTILRIAVIT